QGILGKQYNSKEAEKKWKDFWEKQAIFKFNAKSKKPFYSVDTPPPTVSGKMHIGHAFSYSQQDFLVRFKRMKGFEIFYPFGTDDNGLPTERLIEKTKNIKARDMPRDEFVKLCLNTLKNKLIPEYIQDWKNIGISCDWKVIYSTINDHSRKISQWSFIDLYKKGRIYRKEAPSLWCPECQTGISQVECEDKKVNTNFNTIIFKVGKQELKIATTRPELLGACVSIFYNPEDSRYKNLKGKKAKVPLFNFEVPILEDSRADPEKGTGLVMCCTFGDQTDMEWQKAFNLEIKEAIDVSGRLTSICGKYAGMKIHEARKAIIEDLKSNNLLVEQKPIEHEVKVHERCGTEIEFIKSKQWFVKYLDLREKMLDWGKELKWYPEHMYNRYSGWVKGLQWDWLISRQRFFGVPFPVWYCKKCGETILADEKQLPIDPLKSSPKKKCKCGSSDFEPEKDILDTWFTSSMTPRLSAELFSKEVQNKIFPMSLRPQASEIITFWLFNTVVKSNLHYGKKPFKDVAVSGFVTLGGQKMAKSRGNIIEPQVVLEKYSADALRYWAASSKLGEDVEYQEKEIVAGTRFVNKLFNATKFVFVNLGDYKNKTPKKFEKTDLLFLAELNNLIKEATQNFEQYNYSQARFLVDKFFWQMLCDNYLEIVKNRVYNGTEEEKESARYVLYNSLLTIIKLMAPITPFITEEIYQEYFKKNEKDKSIHLSSWPTEFKIKVKENEEKIFDRLVEILEAVRRAKSEAKKSMKAEVILTLTSLDTELLGECVEDLVAVSCAKEIKEGKEFKVDFV
ncbi:valine--tRNA ligase, partial [Candidatus Pacearchaeota archaeon]|nr:valine--tRNA ligase [Candidatus Pacearchaeota archaeon]